MIHEMRIAKMSDLETIAEIESICFPPEESADRQKIKSRMEAFPEGCFVMTEDEKIIGFINGIRSESPVLTDDMFENAGLHEADGSYLMILSVAVLPEYRRKGHARMMLRHFSECAWEARMKGVTLTCKPELVEFYEKAGFRNHGKSDSVHGGFEWYEMRMTF